MKRRIATDKLQDWINRNEPSGVAKLAIKSKVSVSLIQRILTHHYKSELKFVTMNSLCEATDISLEQLFPKASKGKK